MEKKRHKTFVKFTSSEHPLFREGEIGFIVRGWARRAPDHTGHFTINERGGQIQTLDGKKIGFATEGRDYVRIETTPAIEILYGKYVKAKEQKVIPEKEYGKKYKYKVKQNK